MLNHHGCFEEEKRRSEAYFEKQQLSQTGETSEVEAFDAAVDSAEVAVAIAEFTPLIEASMTEPEVLAGADPRVIVRAELLLPGRVESIMKAVEIGQEEDLADTV
ncbi:hypothetical protein V6N11_078106 [Hibiscus sabdariffa]|uniref:Uncharacterized protein n=1 Tax=Hibiscus sabdariffa TaxID=183260 RepID=A0ABR2TF99_9ROSI